VEPSGGRSQSFDQVVLATPKGEPDENDKIILTPGCGPGRFYSGDGFAGL
jgi:hypothetical protein